MSDVEVSGARECAGLLDDLAAYEARAEIDEISLEAQRKMREYPPELPGQKYIRTYRLRRGWRRRPAQGGVDLVNQVPYAPLVQGESQQAEIHEGRWQTEEEIAREMEQRLADRIERTIERMFH
jgi:hypothetical protein